MRLIYLSVLAIGLSFSMNIFAEKETVNAYIMDKHPQFENKTNLSIYCIDGLRYIQHYHNVLIKQTDINGRSIRCSYLKSSN